MTPKRYRCWLPDNGDESSAKPIDAIHSDIAAEDFARRVWAEENHPDELTVCVREDGSTKVSTYTVDVEEVVEFDAYLEDEQEVPR